MSRMAKVNGSSPTLSEEMQSTREHLNCMAAVAAKFEAWRPAAEVLTRVRAVPTIFPQLDVMLRTNGWPIERFALVHGRSNEGKTVMLHGLGRSFLERGHFYAYVDAEYTTPEDWVRDMMAGLAAHPGFQALRPTTYEQTVDAVRNFCTTIGNAKAKGDLAPDTSGLIVVDSLRKLVPKDLLVKIMKGAEQEPEQVRGRRKAGKRGVDGAGGRAAMIKAAMNAAWLDEVVPMLAQTGTAMVVVARESENIDAGLFGEDFHVQGGKAAYYDSSVVLRVSREKWIREGDEKSAIIGEQLSIELRKTKIGGKEFARPRCHIHTSNGRLTPVGFDRVRDVIELALDHDVVSLAGSWLNYGKKKRLGQGLNNACKRLHADPTLCAEIETVARVAAMRTEAAP